MTADLPHIDCVRVLLSYQLIGIVFGMKTTIDAAGRLVIAKENRQLAGLGPGTAVDMRFSDGLVQIEPVSVPMQLVREGQFLVARPVSNIPPLSFLTVQSTIDTIRSELGG